MDDQCFDVVSRQRACRSFLSDPVDDALIAQILNAATKAPSAENQQPWEFIVVRDTQTRAAITNIMFEAWNNGARAWSATRLTPSTFRDVDAGMQHGFTNAPVWIGVGVDHSKTHETTIGSSVFPATQNLLLAATALGLGSALTTIALHAHDRLAELLALPNHIQLMALTPIGWPLRPLTAPRRDPFAAHTHRDRFGTAW